MEPRVFSRSILKNYRTATTRDGKTIVLHSCQRTRKDRDPQLQNEWLPIVPIEDLVATIQEHYDGAMGINTLMDKVGRDTLT